MILAYLFSLIDVKFGKQGQLLTSMFLKILLGLLVIGAAIALIVFWDNKTGTVIDGAPGILEGMS